MAMFALAPQELPIVSGKDGILRVGGTRVTVDSLVQAFEEGATAEEIAHQYPSVELADIYAVISYFLRETERVHRYLANRDKERTELRNQIAARFDQRGIRDRLLARKSR